MQQKVLTGGCFDLITTGHIFFFHVVRSFGDYLIVNVAPDNRVRAKKGDGRPLRSQLERLITVQNIKGVDRAVSIDCPEGMNETQYEMKCIEEILPNVFCSANPSIEIRKFCERRGVKFIPLPEIWGIDRTHTTDLIQKMKQ